MDAKRIRRICSFALNQYLILRKMDILDGKEDRLMETLMSTAAVSETGFLEEIPKLASESRCHNCGRNKRLPSND